jgi:hypothetical protein
MKRWLTNLWVHAGGIWAAVALLTLWNHFEINAILAAQAQARILQAESVFFKQNYHRLERVRSAHAALTLPVDSLHLGVLAVNSQVSDWCRTLGLSDLKMTVAPRQKESDSIQLNLAFAGSFEKIARFLSLLDAHRYLQEKQVVIKSGSAEAETLCEMTLALKFTVGTGSAEPEAPGRHSAL